MHRQSRTPRLCPMRRRLSTRRTIRPRFRMSGSRLVRALERTRTVRMGGVMVTRPELMLRRCGPMDMDTPGGDMWEADLRHMDMLAEDMQRGDR